MNRTILIFTIAALLFMPCALKAQSDPIDKLFEKYSGIEGFTAVKISEDMFSIISEMSEEKTGDLKDVMDGLSGVRILTYKADPPKHDISKSFYQDIIDNIPLSDYKEIMTVEKKGKNVKILTRKQKGKVNEMLIIVQEDGKVTLISIIGEIKLDKISKLSKSLNIKGLKSLQDDNDDEEEQEEK